MAPGQTGSLLCLVRRSGFRGTPWSRWLTALKIIDRGPLEQVIEVPKVSLQDVVPLRAALCEPQLAEQLVDVPTRPGYALAVVAARTVGWREARALLEQLAASPGRTINTGQG